MGSQTQHIAIALAQRRQLKVHDAQPEQQVGTESPFVDQLFQVTIGGSNDANVGTLFAHAAEPSHGLVFEQLQQLDLDARIDVADLVEKERPARSRFDQPDLALLGVGECATLVTEQLGLEQLPGYRRAIDLDQRRVRALAAEMQRARNQLLAGAGLAGDQHRGPFGIVDSGLGR